MKVMCSVIVPVYNTQYYLKECLESIRMQSFKEFEVLMVNDGSTDRSRDICVEYEKLDSRYHLINKKNGGVGSARNYAMSYIKGKYSIFVDSDDILCLNMLEYMVNAMETTELNVACCEYIENKNLNSYQHSHKNNYHIVSDFCMLMLKDRKIGTAPWNKMVKTSLFNNGNELIKFPENLRIGEDEIWLVNVIKNEKKVVMVDSPLYQYRIREDSATNCLKYGINESDFDDVRAQIELYNSLNYKEVDLKRMVKARLSKKVFNMKIISYAYKQKYYQNCADKYMESYRCKMSDFLCLGIKNYIFQLCKYKIVLMMIRIRINPEILKWIYKRIVR